MPSSTALLPTLPHNIPHAAEDAELPAFAPQHRTVSNNTSKPQRTVRVRDPKSPVASSQRYHHHAHGDDDNASLVSVDTADLPDQQDFHEGRQHHSITNQQAFHAKAPSAKTRSVASDFTDDDANTTTSGISSTARAAREAGMTTIRLCGGVKLRVSFITWTFLAMCVPVVFLVGSTAAAASAASTELATLHRHVQLATDGSNCVTAIAEEHARTLRFVVRGDERSKMLMDVSRANFFSACTTAYQKTLMTVATHNGYFDPAFQAWALAARDIAIVRFRVDKLTADSTTNTTASTNASASATTTMTSVGEQERTALAESLQAAFDVTSDAVTDAISLPADLLETKAGRLFLDIKVNADARKALWTAIAATLVVAGEPANSTRLVSGLPRAIAAANSALSTLAALRGVATPDLRTLVLRWQNDADTVALFGLFSRIASVHSTTSDDDVWGTGRRAALELRAIEEARVDVARKAQDSRVAAATNIAVLCSGVACCVVASALLAWQQLRTKAQLEDQVMRAEKTRKAVSAFVPKFFLSKMGYTSITQVQVGESTDVALAMMFSDIRKFTNVSEGMGSTQLFEWVQGYFQRMTTIIERSEGNISQFVGDSLFAVFSSCRQAVTCGIDMQAEVQELNIDCLCRNKNDIPIEIGVGLHHDVLAMGVLGDANRHTVTAISASVNLASRLEGLTKQLGCRILASEAVIEQLANDGPRHRRLTGRRRDDERINDDGDTASYHDDKEEEEFLMRRVGPAVVKGSTKPVVIYDIYQADERAVQQLKRETRVLFEEYAAAALAPESDEQDVFRLRAMLTDAAVRRFGKGCGEPDRLVSQLLAFRQDVSGSMVFDEK